MVVSQIQYYYQYEVLPYRVRCVISFEVIACKKSVFNWNMRDSRGASPG